jgi:hypothetical protein
MIFDHIKKLKPQRSNNEFRQTLMILKVSIKSCNIIFYISQLPPEVQPKPSVSGRQSTQMSGIGAVLA